MHGLMSFFRFPPFFPFSLVSHELVWKESNLAVDSSKVDLIHFMSIAHGTIHRDLK